MFEVRENWWFGQGKVREKSGKSTLNLLWPPWLMWGGVRCDPVGSGQVGYKGLSQNPAFMRIHMAKVTWVSLSRRSLERRAWAACNYKDGFLRAGRSMVSEDRNHCRGD